MILEENLSLKYPEMLKRFRQRYNEADALKVVMNQVAMEEDALQSVQSCLSLGTGYGEFDISFIKICLPNLKKLIVVEVDHDCVEELKVNLTKSFGEELEVEIHEISIQTFMENTEIFSKKKVDIVFAFHVLYYLGQDVRRRFLELCFNSWLKPESGLFVLLHVSEKFEMVKIRDQLKNFLMPFLLCEHIKDEARELGLVIKKEFPYSVLFDLKEFGEDIYCLLNYLIKNTKITRDIVKEAMIKTVPTGWGTFAAELCVVSCQ